MDRLGLFVFGLPAPAWPAMTLSAARRQALSADESHAPVSRSFSLHHSRRDRLWVTSPLHSAPEKASQSGRCFPLQTHASTWQQAQPQCGKACLPVAGVAVLWLFGSAPDRPMPKWTERQTRAQTFFPGTDRSSLSAQRGARIHDGQQNVTERTTAQFSFAVQDTPTCEYFFKTSRTMYCNQPADGSYLRREQPCT